MTLTASQLLKQLKWRYAVKKFDSTKKISAKDWEALEEALVLTPSSYGLQPWHFFVIDDPDVRNQLLPHSWNQKQVVEASHFVVFAVKTKLTEKNVAEFVDRMAEVRKVPRETFLGYEKVMINDVVHGPRGKHQKEWASLQTYIALGNLMTSAAMMGIDACPMEGLDPVQYDKILKLPKENLATVCACALGYRHAEDKYADAKKVRFEKEKVLSHI